jgi:hypothetical protein
LDLAKTKNNANSIIFVIVAFGGWMDWVAICIGERFGRLEGKYSIYLCNLFLSYIYFAHMIIILQIF